MRSIALAIPLLTVSLAAATPADAHARLARAEPASGSSVRSAPPEVVLTFTEKLEPAFSRIEVKNAKGERVDAGGSSASGTRMRVSLKPLAAGRYTVKWRVLSVDTHRAEGSFSFEVSP